MSQRTAKICMPCVRSSILARGAGVEIRVCMFVCVRAHTHTQTHEQRGGADPMVLWEDTKKWVDQIKKSAKSK